MTNLFEALEIAAQFNGRRDLPGYIRDGLRSSYELRPYQTIALQDFIAHFEMERDEVPWSRKFPSQTLFHMATGSGKTLVMAALILYLYGRGYRDFLFFVNSTNVLEKTRDNFLNAGSSKYLFREDLRMNGDPILVQEVTNFQESQPDGVNICFSTIQGLHTDLTFPREDQMTFDDFEERRVVLISDEAHHINALTKRSKDLSQAEIDEERSWENTVARIFGSHPENVMLEFTATLDLANPAIAAKYEDKIVANYPLERYRSDGYSKEITLLQSDLSPVERALQAVVLSQHRLKLFERQGIAIKPVVLFKSRTIAESREFYELFEETVVALDDRHLSAIRDTTTAPRVQQAFAFFEAEGITLDLLALELRDDFASHRCLSINSRDIEATTQISVNTLEATDNPYRAVFAVDMLNEGWDVLNLFDIVRLFDTRDAKAGKPGRTTTQEAQLIGRGARYCPFRLQPEDDPYTRKFDGDLTHHLRACEELIFHSSANVRYIEELRTALRETGALPKQAVEVEYLLKEEFVEGDLYRHGWIFTNKRLARERSTIVELPESIRSRSINHRSGRTGASRTGEAFGLDVGVAVATYQYTKRIRDLPPRVISTALRRNDNLRFDTLRDVLPNLPSLKSFWESPSYLGEIQITLETSNQDPGPEEWLRAADAALRVVASSIKQLALEHFGSRDFEAKPLQTTITNRSVYVADPSGNGSGIAQSRVTEELRLDLSNLDWYGYTENYGTTEEKRFLTYFNGQVGRFQSEYDLVVVLRNESQVTIYDFDTGRPFQPDFLLILRQASDHAYRHYQLFVEPKGGHLTEKDRWKEDLLLRLQRDGRPVKKLGDDNEYLIWGLPFFTHEPPQDRRRFTDAVEQLMSSGESATA